MPYHHLLVPVDLSDPDVVIEAALDLAAQHRAQTTLLYVIEAISETSDPADDEEDLTGFYETLMSSVRERLNVLARRFEQSGLPVKQEILVGHGPREIVQYSATQPVDLIVMRSQRVDLNHLDQSVTSVSHQVSLFCQCPVMLVK